MILNKSWLPGILFFILGVASRGLLASNGFTHLDSVLYAIGTFDYSIAEGTPPSPGYFLYIMSAKLLNLVTHDPHASLMLLGIFYSGSIAALIYYFGLKLGGRMAGIAAGLLFLSSPVMWFKGVTIWAYLNSGFFIILFAFLCQRALTLRRADILYFCSFFLAVLVGIRPQELISVAMLYLYVLIRIKCPLKSRVKALVIFGAACAAWFFPFIKMTGGYDQFSLAMQGSRDYMLEDSFLTGAHLSKINNHLVRMVPFFFRTFFLSAAVLFYYLWMRLKDKNIFHRENTGFFLAWLLPGVLYNIFMQFGEIGHGMGWGLGLFLLIGQGVVFISKGRKKAYLCIMCLLVGANCWLFFHDFKVPYEDYYEFSGYRHFNYREVLDNNRFLLPKIAYIRNKYDLTETAVVASTVFSAQVMYYLPQALVISPSILRPVGKMNYTVFYDHKGQRRQGERFVLPDRIRHLIIFDDKFFGYFQGKNASLLDTGNGYGLLEQEVRPGQQIKFGLHSILLG